MLSGGGAAVARLVYEETILTWRNGPQMLLFSIAHQMPGAILLGYSFVMLSHIWALVALSTIAYRMYQHRPVRLSSKLLLGAALVVLAPLYVPYGWWRYLVFRIAGPGTHGSSHITCAACQGELYNVRALVNHGVSADATTDDRMTALMCASAAGRLDIVKYLIDAGAKVDRQGGFLSRTALMEAAAMDHPDVVAYLLRAGADRTLVDREGKSALDMARERNTKAVLSAPRK